MLKPVRAALFAIVFGLAQSGLLVAQGTPRPSGPVLQTTGAFFAVSVADARATARWYAEKLGLQIVMDVPRQPETKAAVIVLRGGGLTVEIVQQDAAVPLQKGLSVHGIFKVGVVVNDFDRTLNDLKARKVEIAMGPWPARPDQPANVIIKDSAGTLIQVFGKL